MKNLIFATAVLLAFANISLAEEVLRYALVTGNTPVPMVVSRSVTGANIEISAHFGSMSEKWVVVKGKGVSFWSFASPSQNMSFKAVRLPNGAVDVSGNSQGKPFQKRIQLSPTIPWGQSVDISLAEFKTSPQIYYLRDKTFRPVIFEISPKHSELIETGGKRQTLQKYTMKPKGFMRLFWKAHFWLREDGILIKKVIDVSPKSVMELLPNVPPKKA